MGGQRNKVEDQKKQGGWSKKTRSGGQKITRWEVRKTRLGGQKFLPIWFDSLPILPGSAAGAAALNPAMPRRVVWEAKHSFSYPGARPCRRPSPKILQPAGVFTFLGVRGGKKEGKI